MGGFLVIAGGPVDLRALFDIKSTQRPRVARPSPRAALPDPAAHPAAPIRRPAPPPEPGAPRPAPPPRPAAPERRLTSSLPAWLACAVMGAIETPPPPGPPNATDPIGYAGPGTGPDPHPDPDDSTDGAGTVGRPTVRVGLLGCGNVGASVARFLLTDAKRIADRTGIHLELAKVAVRSATKERDVPGVELLLTTDPVSIVTDPSIDVVVEVMGGISPTRDLLLQALRSGKPVVSANKELLANHGGELWDAASAAGVDLLFEASVAGGIPLIRALRESLAGERIHRVMGIVNGTTNYILSRMSVAGASYQEALAEAQSLGYAERDPTADVEGYDAAAKAAILANVAFGAKVVAGDVYREGISGLNMLDFEAAKRLGFEIKLLAVVESGPDGVAGRPGPPRHGPPGPPPRLGARLFQRGIRGGRRCRPVDAAREGCRRASYGQRRNGRPRRRGPQPDRQGGGAKDGAPPGSHQPDRRLALRLLLEPVRSRPTWRPRRDLRRAGAPWRLRALNGTRCARARGQHPGRPER